MNGVGQKRALVVAALLMVFAVCAAYIIDQRAGVQPRGENGRPELGRQLDREGRPVIIGTLLSPFADSSVRDPETDAYNGAAPDAWAPYGTRFREALALWDGFDGICGNQLWADRTETRYGFLAELMAADRLYVDSSGGACQEGYFGLELRAHDAGSGVLPGCGGRTPNDNVVDVSYTLFINGHYSGLYPLERPAADRMHPEFPFLRP